MTAGRLGEYIVNITEGEKKLTRMHMLGGHNFQYLGK